MGFTSVSHSRLKWTVPKMIKCNSMRGENTDVVRVMQLSLTYRKEHQGVLNNPFIKYQARLTFE